MTRPTDDTPPLPHLGTITTNTGTSRQNEWQLLIESVPVHAEVPRFFLRRGGFSAVRSPFRVGKMEVTPNGLRLEGMATNPVAWLKVVGALGFFFSWIVQFGLIITRRFVSFTGATLWIWSFSPLLGAIIFVVVNFVNERRREPATIVVAWGDVLDLQQDKAGRFITLVYKVPSDARPVQHYITLNKLDPATTAGLVTTVEHFAPEACRHRFAAQKEQRTRTWGAIIATTLVVIVCACVVFLKP